MNIKLKNKKHIMKISAFAVLLVFVSALLFNMNVVDTKAQDMKEISINNKVKVLEVGPGNYSRLNSNGIGTTTDGNYEITYMSMPEFISKVNDISGLYDVIAITNNNNNSLESFSNTILPQYVQYSAEFSEKIIPLKYDSASYPSPRSVKPKNSGDKLNDGNIYYEFYSENDITNKRANDIIEAINRGQLVYVENSTLIEGTRIKENFSNINKSNLKKVDSVSLNTIKSDYESGSYNKKPKVTQFYSSKDDIDNPNTTTNLGNKENKKIKFKFKAENVSSEFKVNIYLDWNADSIFKFVEDTSDGMRNELVKTINLNSDSKDSEGYYNIELDNNEIRNGFVGYLNWNVEIFSGIDEANSTKTSIIGESTFKRLTNADKVKLKVLQVYPSSGYLLSSDDFKGYLDDVDDYDITIISKTINDFNSDSNILFRDEYDMIILGFGDSYGGEYDFNEAAIANIKKFIDEGKAAMFTHDTMALSTSYSQQTTGVGPTKFTEAFKSIIGQSRYENDTTELKNVSSKYVDSVGDELGAIVNNDGSVTFRVKYNDAGSMYIAGSMFNNSDWNQSKKQMQDKGNKIFEYTMPANELNSNEVYEYKFVVNGNGWIRDPNNDLVGDDNKSLFSTGYIEVKSLGQTNLVANDAAINSQTNKGCNLYGQTLTQTVREVNKAQITSYPYDLGKTGTTAGLVDGGNNSIKIATTHTQWYQLDLEDEELVPWFNLYSDGSKLFEDKSREIFMNSGDSRNFYYTYSKGNITYSGTGHSSNFTDAEKKLFVNTIIKAARGATNEPPKIESYEISTANDTSAQLVNEEYRRYFENEEEISVESRNDYKFYTTAYDEDGDDVDMDVTITDEQTGQQLVNSIQGIIKKGDNINERIEINIPQSILYEYGLAEKRIKVTVNADDNFKDAESSGKDSKVYYIKPSVELETYTIQHGMYNLTYAAGTDLTQLTDADKLPEINDWYNGTDFNDRLISSTTNSVSYFATVPFASKTTVYKDSSLKLSIDSNLEVSDSVKVYKIVKDNTGAESLVYIKDMTLQNNEYTCDLSELTDFTTDIVVKYKAKTMAQPEVTSTVTANGIEQDTGEIVTFTNKIKVLRNGDTVSSDDASVQVGRGEFNRDLF